MNAFTDRSLIEFRDKNANGLNELPAPPSGTPSTKDVKAWFPEWTHRLHPEFGDGQP